MYVNGAEVQKMFEYNYVVVILDIGRGSKTNKKNVKLMYDPCYSLLIPEGALSSLCGPPS